MNAQQPNLEIVGAGDEYIGDGYIEYIRNADLSFQHLQAELLRIDLLIRRQVLGWQKAGQDPKDAFRGLYIADSEAAALVEHPLGANWGQFGLLTAEEEAWFARALEKASGRSSDIVEQAHAQGVTLCLDSLAAGFGWQPFDRETFLICAAPFLDLKYERLYGYLQDDVTRKRPTVNLVLDLLCPTGAEAMGTSAMGTSFSNNVILVGNLDIGMYFTLDATMIPAASGPLELLITVDYTDDFNLSQVITRTLTVEVQEMTVPEPGMEGNGGSEIVPELAPETFWQKVLRFVKGLLGLGSGRPEPAPSPDMPVEELPVEEVPSQGKPLKGP